MLQHFLIYFLFVILKMLCYNNCMNERLNPDNKLLTRKKIKLLPLFLKIVFPLFFYHLLELAYSSYDIFVLSATGIGDPGSVVLFTQIKGLISTIGSSIITGFFIYINIKLGEKQNDKVKSLINQLVYILLIVSLFCVLLFIGAGKLFLQLLQTPIDIINSSYGYYVVTIISLIISWFNSIYTSILTATGKPQKTMCINIAMICTKIVLSTIVVFGGIFNNITSTHLAVCTLISQFVIFIPSLFMYFKRKGEYQIFTEKFNLKIIKEPFKSSLPIMAGSIVFNAVKVIINSMIVNSYGSFVLTCTGFLTIFLGIGNNFVTATRTALGNISGQAYGNGDLNHSQQTYKISAVSGLIVCVLNIILFILLRNPLCMLAMNNDVQSAQALMIFILVSAFENTMSRQLEILITYFNSMKMTHIKFWADLIRTLIIRLPLDAILIYVFDIGYYVVPIGLLASNGVAFIVVLILKHYYKNKSKGDRLNNNTQINNANA